MCIVHFIPIPPISSNTEIEISQFAGPRNSFEIKYLSLSAARTSRRGEGSIRANRSKVRHLNNLFLVLPFPSVPRLLHAREPAGRLARRNFNGGTQAAPHGSSVLWCGSSGSCYYLSSCACVRGERGLPWQKFYFILPYLMGPTIGGGDRDVPVEEQGEAGTETRGRKERGPMGRRRQVPAERHGWEGGHLPPNECVTSGVTTRSTRVFHTRAITCIYIFFFRLFVSFSKKKKKKNIREWQALSRFLFQLARDDDEECAGRGGAPVNSPESRPSCVFAVSICRDCARRKNCLFQFARCRRSV